jgi:hypothetical protein
MSGKKLGTEHTTVQGKEGKNPSVRQVKCRPPGPHLLARVSLNALPNNDGMMNARPPP